MTMCTIYFHVQSTFNTPNTRGNVNELSMSGQGCKTICKAIGGDQEQSCAEMGEHPSINHLFA